jgi:tetratricopeptide (TPR) repeat protein
VTREWLLARVAVLGLALLMGACATAAEKAPPAPVATRAPVAPAPPPPPPPPPAPDPRAPLIAHHRAQAEALERDGELRRALDEWKIVLTIDPADSAARQSLAALEGRIERAVTERIEAGKAALARGVQAEARRQFLAALALDPANRTAFEALQSEAGEVEFITHTVKQGETLASLAERYYGDRSRLEVIWETNQLPPHPKLVAGMTLKIPEIPGVPFIHPEAKRPAPPVATPAVPSVPRGEAPPGEAVKEEAAKEEAAKDEYTRVNPLLAEAREALERSDYGDALSGIDRFLAGNPDNQEGLTVKKQALYQQGKSYLAGQRWEESFRTLTQLARLEPNYQDTAALLKQARARAIEQHYREGVRLYRQEKPAEAIVEWRAVLALDPEHANAKRNIDQAERLLKALEQRKKK